ncbi:hypothetical protein SLEP1_g58714, partial [Rubroshorea leprosula]
KSRQTRKGHRRKPNNPEGSSEGGAHAGSSMLKRLGSPATQASKTSEAQRFPIKKTPHRRRKQK